jgi:hypothetical protein
VGGFKLNRAYAPLCRKNLIKLAFTYTCGVLVLGCSKFKKTLNKDGTMTEQERLPVHLSIDHRYADGAIAAKMIKQIKYYFENPEEVEKL